MKIGLACIFYGSPKGHSVVNKNIVGALLEEGHEVHMYRYTENPILPGFPVPTSMKSSKEHIIQEKDFQNWLDEKKLDWCIFNEYDQWYQDINNKLLQCSKAGVKTAGFLVWEKIDYDRLSLYKQYDIIISPTAFQTKLLRSKGLYKTKHVPWGTDIKEIDSISPMENREKKKLVFYHCAGSGGVGDRKNTQSIIAAYNKIKDENTELLITHLGNKVFEWDDIIRLTKYSDVLINTSRWDTMGLNTYEANACGKPVIVCDANPMNEIVKNNVNGSLVSCKLIEKVPWVTCPSAEVDIEDLARKMNLYKNELILKTLQNNSRKIAETNFNWNENKKHLLALFR